MLNSVYISEPTDQLTSAPGTCLFDPPEADETEAAGRLKRHPTKVHIILRPQPTDSALDPLNWSRVRKEALFFVFLVGSVCTGVIGPILVPAFGNVAEDLGVTVPEIAQLNGVLVLFEGIAGILCVIASAFWGRRSSYLVTTAMQFLGCIWGALSTSYASLYGARVIQGMGMAAFAVLLGSTITDLFFVHEHGVRIALWQVTYIAAVNLTPIISGPIATSFGWRMCFWILGAFEGATLIGVIFLCPETKTHLRIGASDAKVPDDKPQQEFIEKSEIPGATTASESGTAPTESLSFVNSLKFWGPTFREDSVLVTITRPCAIVCAPHIFWATIAYTLSFTWYVVTGATYFQIYGAQYYSESISSVGLIAGIAPLIGTFAACMISGPLTDYSAQFLAVRNRGVFEPEFRLVVLVPAFVLTAIGGFGWAFTVGPEWNLLVSTSLAGFLFAGVSLGLCGVVAYGNACYPAQGGDTFAVMLLVRSAFIFGCTYFINTWLAVEGIEHFFGIWTAITLAVYAQGIPVYIYGKRMRVATAKSWLLGWAAH